MTMTRRVHVALFTFAAACLAAAPAPAPTGGATTAPAGDLPGWAAGYTREIAGITPTLLSLWDGPTPNQRTGDAVTPERNDGERVWEVNVPGALVYLPSKEKLAASGGTCIIECMGGAYTHLTRLVGADNTVAPFTARGIAVVSLKYRVRTPATDVEPDAVLDGRRAIRLARAHAAKWGINPDKIGMLGWSAGGNLILSLATHLDNGGAGDPAARDPVERESCRPNFVVMLSPWPNAKKIDAYQAAKDAPPAFIGSARDDRTAPFAFAQDIQATWQKAGVPVELMAVDTGGHGAFELGTGTAGDWTQKVFPWLEKGGFLNKAP
jgi:endo-1,4-beta-xylanase